MPKIWVDFKRLLRAVQPIALASVLALGGCNDSMTPDPQLITPGGPSNATAVTLATLDVTTCQYGGEYPNCKSAPIDWGWNPNFPPVTPTGTSATGDGGGGTSPNGDNTAPPDTVTPCDPTLPGLGDTTVQAGLTRLWEHSNPYATQMGDRRERFAWLVYTPDGGWVLHEVTIQSSVCGFDGEIPWPPEGKAAIRAFVHVHPYRFGEVIPVCGGASANHSLGYLPYEGIPSDIDRETSLSLGEQVYGTSGAALTGLIIDSDNILAFVGNDMSRDGAMKRCGY
jgi:hypothetical protein